MPVVYHDSAERRLSVTAADGSTRAVEGDTLDEATSAELLRRSGRIRRLDVWTSPGA